MSSNPPTQIKEFCVFLTSTGLRQTEHLQDVKNFGNSVIKYSDERIAVRMVLDRGKWFIEVSDVPNPHTWFDPALVRDLIADRGNDELSIEQQIDFVQTHWPKIRELFTSENRKETFDKLKALSELRVQ